PNVHLAARGGGVLLRPKGRQVVLSIDLPGRALIAAAFGGGASGGNEKAAGGAAGGGRPLDPRWSSRRTSAAQLACPDRAFLPQPFSAGGCGVPRWCPRSRRSGYGPARGRTPGESRPPGGA